MGWRVIWRTEEETHSLLFGNSPDLCFPHVLLPFVFYVNKIKSIQLSNQLVHNTTFAIGKKRWTRPRPLCWLTLWSYLRWTELLITEKRVISQISREDSLQRAGGFFFFLFVFLVCCLETREERMHHGRGCWRTCAFRQRSNLFEFIACELLFLIIRLIDSG